MALPRFVSSYLMFFSFGQGASFEWEDVGDSPSPTIHFSTIRNHVYEGRTWTACVDTLIMQMTSSSVSVSMAAFSPFSILLVGLPTPLLATPSFLTGGDLAL